jgi:DNA-binding NtrC family response regulator
VTRGRVLVLDDDPAVVELLTESLRAEGFDCEGETRPWAALAKVEGSSYDVVVSDVEMPELRGIELLQKIHAVRPEQLVLLMTAFGSIELAMAAVRAGACDFIAKPFPIEALVRAIDRAIEDRTLRRELVRLRARVDRGGDEAPLARSPAMIRTLERARRAATAGTAVLLTGETGTGKSLLARYIHERSSRNQGPYLEVNCAAIPPTLLESELFGARRGAFSGAVDDREGFFVRASGGTLFLDEIGELSPEAQAKLLHAVEKKTVLPLGGTSEVSIDTRLIAATHRALEAMVAEGSFRKDLYYRIHIVRIEVPPLRDRKEDILPLAERFLERAIDRQGSPVRGFSARAVRLLLRHPWPGNVRELENVVERAVALAEHDALLPHDLDLEEPSESFSLARAATDGLTLEAAQRAYIRHVVERYEGNKAAAARALGITRQTRYKKLGDD